MRRVLSRATPRVDEENPYWISFSDLMSALLIIFMLAVISLIIELTQRTQHIDEGIEKFKMAEQARKSILNEVRDSLKKQNITVLIANDDTIIIQEETLRFASGSEQIPNEPAMQDAVRSIGTAIHTAIVKDRRFEYLDTVFIEGHTDSVPIWYRGKKNWGLSTDRAISVWKVWEDELLLSPKLGDIINERGQRLFSVSGYAATRRIQLIEDTPQQRILNRRINIRFTVKTPPIGDLEKIKPTYKTQ